MNVWLDDNRPAPQGWKHAKTVEQAKLYLIMNRVERLSMDHDLDMPDCPTCQFECSYREGGCKHGCACHAAGAEPGMALVAWMAETGRWPAEKPVVHSANPEGGMKMQAAIDAAWPR